VRFGVRATGNKNREMKEREKKMIQWAAGACLCLVVFFSPVFSSDFVYYDDPAYVTANSHVLGGLSVQNIGWAFQTFDAGNWHPLTWLSHMSDVQVFGLESWAHHAVNLALHVFNSLLLFSVLRRLTGEHWRSALVAGLFAVHPMHVESVAWVAERKDVLSGFFFLLTLCAYLRYCSESNTSKVGWYGTSLFLFALGLCSKAMLVTTPFVLLLLDWWPLKRLGTAPSANHSEFSAPKTKVWFLLLEKLPFLMLSAVSSALTFRAQKAGGAFEMLADVSLSGRIANAIVSYCRYLGKLFWPMHLSVFYPHPGHWSSGIVLSCAALLLVVSLIAFFLRTSRPFLLLGWLWFVGMLVPVIGIVQVGLQSLADRYTYLPYIGLFIALVWAAPLQWASSILRRRVLATAAGVVLCLLGLRTFSQARYWSNTRTLFEHAVSVSPDNAVAQNNLGNCLMSAGEITAAEVHFAKAVGLNPRYRIAIDNLGSCIARDPQRWEEARRLFQWALTIENSPTTHYNLGFLDIQEGQVPEAENHLRAALKLKPDYVQARFNLALLLYGQGRLNDAAGELRKVLEAQPTLAIAHVKLGVILTDQQQWNAALSELKLGLQQIPNHPEGCEAMGAALLAQGQYSEALPYLQIGLATDAGSKAHYRLAVCLHAAGMYDEAASHYREAVVQKPNEPEYLNDYAWLLAACTRPEIRDGNRARDYAAKACQLTAYTNAAFVGTLAAADAEAGKFEGAITNAQRAISLAQSNNAPETVSKNRELLELYRQHKGAHGGRPAP
jgi:tetratricopeptide (TPR) repeat protein